MPEPLPPLSPVEQRAEELASEADTYYRRHGPGAYWAPSRWAVRLAVGELAEIVLPIFRRAQERIAQRAAELVLERLNNDERVATVGQIARHTAKLVLEGLREQKP